MFTKTRMIAFLCLAGLSLDSVAFDGMEHERLADNAIVLGLSYWLQDGDPAHVDGSSTRLDLCTELTDRFGTEGVVTLVRHCMEENAKPITYGGAVRVVDELLFPQQIFVREGRPVAHRDPASNLLPRTYEELNHRYNVRRELRRRFRSTNAVLEGYRALSFNQVHFQNDLLQKMQSLRLLAHYTAEDEIYYSLIANALSDHFLQDYLAPGHILWPRNHSHDSVATSVHDGTNQKGAWFEVNSQFWDDNLRALADYAQDLAESSQTNQIMNQYWLKRRADADYICPGGGLVQEQTGDLNEGLLCLFAAIQTDDRIFLYGDGLVSKSPAQQMLMILVQAERIVELMRAHEGVPPKVLRRYEDIVSFDENYTALMVPTTGLNFGDYRFICEGCGGRYNSEQEVFEETVRGVLLFGVGGQAPFRNVGSARYQLALEYLPLGVMANNERVRNATIHRPPGGCRTWSYCNTGIAFGVDYVHDGEFTAPGVGLRFIKAIPSVNLQLSPYVKFLNYRFAQQTDWNLSWGVRADWGFSIGSFYISAGKEYFVNEFTALESTGMVSFGVGVGLPMSRVRKWTVDNRRYKPEDDY